MSDAETLLCDVCDGAWHMACLRPPLTMIPEGDWKCPGCVEIEEEKKNEEQAAKRTRLVEVKDGDEPLLEVLNRIERRDGRTTPPTNGVDEGCRGTLRQIPLRSTERAEC